jgi:general stress protein YciG
LYTFIKVLRIGEFFDFLAPRHASCFSSGLELPQYEKGDPEMAQTRGMEGRTSNRGFASMNQERQRQIASMGGKAVPDSKRSFSQNRDLAAQAGRKGGQSVPGEKRSFSQNRELAAQAGRKGGQSVPDEKRSFSQNPGLAAQAGRKGGQASHGALPPHELIDK